MADLGTGSIWSENMGETGTGGGAVLDKERSLWSLFSSVIDTYPLLRVESRKAWLFLITMLAIVNCVVSAVKTIVLISAYDYVIT